MVLYNILSSTPTASHTDMTYIQYCSLEAGPMVLMRRTDDLKPTHSLLSKLNSVLIVYSTVYRSKTEHCLHYVIHNYLQI